MLVGNSPCDIENIELFQDTFQNKTFRALVVSNYKSSIFYYLDCHKTAENKADSNRSTTLLICIVFDMRGKIYGDITFDELLSEEV